MSFPSASRHSHFDREAVDLALLDDGLRWQRKPADIPVVARETGPNSPGLTRTPSAHDEPPPARQGLLHRLPASRKAVYGLPLLAVIAPLVALLARAPHLDQGLASSSCTPAGEFVLPLTASVWEPSRFFEITIQFSPPYGSGVSCGRLEDADPLGSCRTGYSFTQVEAIDLARDVLVGRGVQALLVLLAYSVFSRTIAALMEHGEVGYDMFATVAFNAGTLSSIITLVRHAVGLTPVPRTRRAILAYVGMALTTVYVVFIPSLVSAMTGYVPLYTPYFRIGAGNFANASIIECGGDSLLPVWGRMSTNVPHEFYSGNSPVLSDEYLIVDDRSGSFYINVQGAQGGEWIDYYDSHRAVYESCPAQLNISDCAAAQQQTTVREEWSDATAIVSAPMPGIVPYSNTTRAKTGSKSKYTHWLCGYFVVSVDDMINFDPDVYSYSPRAYSPSAAVDVCESGTAYAWGFSFLFTLLVLILQLLFTLLMYALAIAATRRAPPVERQGARGEFKDAVTLVAHAQAQFGEKVVEWSAEGLKRRLYGGKTGMSNAVLENSDRREGRPVGKRVEDDYGGDWGGEVAFEHRP